MFMLYQIHHKLGTVYNQLFLNFQYIDSMQYITVLFIWEFLGYHS